MTLVRPPESILHVDMDAFFAAVEVRRDPALRGRPVLVGGIGRRGVVASASYEARVFGVTSAMPVGEALRRCPQAIVLPPDFTVYQRASSDLMALMRDLTPLVEPLALDEAFCDVSGAVRLLGQPVEIARSLRRRITGDLGLTASVGVAPNKFLAKLCSTKAKPDGLLHLREGEVDAFLAPLDLSDLWGVGPKTAGKLARHGLHQVRDILGLDQATLAALVGVAAARQLHHLSRGRDQRTVVPHQAAKGMSAEETFADDVADARMLRTELLRLCQRVATRLRRGRLAARTVALKLRFADFRTITRAHTMALPSDQAGELHGAATDLLTVARSGQAVRLIGVRVSGLLPAGAAHQLRLLDDNRWELIEEAIDRARERFGEEALTRAALLARDLPARPNPGSVGREELRG